MASAAAAIPVDTDFYQEIQSLNDEYTRVVTENEGKPMDPYILFNLFMLMITVMSGNSKVYSNAFALSGLGTMAAFNSTLAGMAFQFSDMVAKGEPVGGSQVAQLLNRRPDLIAMLEQQAENIKEIQIETERDSPLERMKARTRAQQRRREQLDSRAAADEEEEEDVDMEPPTADAGQITKKRKLGMRGGYFEEKTKRVLANAIMASMVLAGIGFVAYGGLAHITTSLYSALASSAAFQDSSHCLSVIGYSKNWLITSVSGAIKPCSVLFDENRAAVDFITTKVQVIWAASIAAVGGFSYAAWGNIRDLIINYLIDPADQLIDYLNPQKVNTQEIINKFLDGLITTSAAASWANEEARMAGQPGAQNNWVIQANKDQGDRPKLYFNFTQAQLVGTAITISNLKDVAISMELPNRAAPQANFPGPPAVESVRGVPAPPVELKLAEQEKFYSIIRSLEEDKQNKAAAPALAVAGVGQAPPVVPPPAAPGQSAAAAVASQGPGQGGKKRRRTMKKKKHHRKNKTGKKKHHKKKHHKKHKKSHKKHHKKHGRKTRKH